MDVVAGEGANGFRVVDMWDSGRPAGQVTQAHPFQEASIRCERRRTSRWNSSGSRLT